MAVRRSCISIAFCLVMVPTVAAADSPKASALSLFTSFKTICVDTSAVPYAANARAKEAGGKILPWPDGVIEPPPITGTIWENVLVGGSKFTVATGEYQGSWPPDWEGWADICAITGEVRDDESISSIRNWAGVAADPTSSSETYYFQIVGEHHLPLPDDLAQRHALEQRGKVWVLEVSSGPSPNVTWVHHLAPGERHQLPARE